MEIRLYTLSKDEIVQYPIAKLQKGSANRFCKIYKFRVQYYISFHCFPNPDANLAILEYKTSLW